MLKYLIEKEFKQIARNKFLPRLILAFPLMMMLVMPWAANQEIKDIKLAVVDNDHSVNSSRLINKIDASDYFRIVSLEGSYADALNLVEYGDADVVFEIPLAFDKHLHTERLSDVMIASNSVNGIKGTMGSAYLASIVADFITELQQERGIQSAPNGLAASFSTNVQHRFNTRLDYKVFMVPALMVMLLTMICGFLPALNIVGEKESGTIEQINVTPISRATFVLAKLIPYWIIGFIILTLCMLLARLVYGIVPAGSLLTIYLFASLYVLVVSGFGLLISNYSHTMQQAMFVMFFFVLILLLMSGLFTPVTSMPDWAQLITVANPLKYFMQVMRMVYLKGSTFMDMLPQFFALIGFAFFFNTWAILSYRKSS